MRVWCHPSLVPHIPHCWRDHELKSFPCMPRDRIFRVRDGREPDVFRLNVSPSLVDDADLLAEKVRKALEDKNLEP